MRSASPLFLLALLLAGPAAPARGQGRPPSRLDAALEAWFAAPAGEEPRLPPEAARLLRRDFDAFRERAWTAWKASPAVQEWIRDHEERRVRHGALTSPYTLKRVGERPENGWPLVIALHGGGGVPPEVNDQQWRHMQIYYRDHPGVSGYLYLALRAPDDTWNGFYKDAFYPLLQRLRMQLLAAEEVDPDRVILIGYSHGGYGVFACAPKMPDLFATAHASAAAPTDGQSDPLGLHDLPFSFFCGEKDTAYGRIERCRRFAAALEELRTEHPGAFPFTWREFPAHGHTGLPDRDRLAELLPHRRRAWPPQLWWRTTDGVIEDHYWLRLPAPEAGLRIEVSLEDGVLRIEGPERPLEIALGEELHPPGAPLRLEGKGRSRRLRPRPEPEAALRHLRRRGDPALMPWAVLRLEP